MVADLGRKRGLISVHFELVAADRRERHLRPLGFTKLVDVGKTPKRFAPGRCVDVAVLQDVVFNKVSPGKASVHHGRGV